LFFHELIKPDTCKSSLELIAEMYAQPHFRIQTSFFILQINLGIYMEDNKTEFSVLVDRAIGGSSLQDGQIELMLHRYVLF